MRIVTRLQRALTACTVIAGTAASGCRAQAPSFDGTYAVAFAGGSMTLTLRTLESGEIVGRIDGGGAVLELSGRAVTDEDGDVSVEGTLTGPGGRSDFTLFPDDEGAFALVMVPYDGAGTPRADLTSVYAVARIADDVDAASVADAPTHGARQPGPASAAARDPRIVGTWSTQVIVNSDVGNVATQLRMQFSADGVMRDLGSRSMGDIAGGIFDVGAAGGGDEAGWRTEGDVIWMSYAGSAWFPFARFQISGTQLLLTYLHDGSRQLWHRAGS